MKSRGQESRTASGAWTSWETGALLVGAEEGQR